MIKKNNHASGKLDFARVLVEVSADDDLPSSLEIAYPPLGNRPAKIGVLDVIYQWKPTLCTHCKTFGHTTLSCKIRPRTEEELAAKNSKIRLVGLMLLIVVTKGLMMKVYGCWQEDQTSVFTDKWSGDGDFRPRVLVRRSGSIHADKSSRSEDIPVKNSFQALDDQLMKDKDECVLDAMEEEEEEEEEYRSEIWPTLKPKIDYFYKNCHKYGLDPSFEDDDDVATEDGGMATEMRSEDVDLEARSIDNNGAPIDDVSNWVSNNASCSNGTGIIVGWDPSSVRVMVLSRLGQSYSTAGMEDFRGCLGEMGVEDLVMSGRPGRTDGLLKKLDRVMTMSNFPFVEKFVNSNAQFLPFVASAVVEIPVISRAKPSPFRFANFLANKAEFLPIVKDVWDRHIPGHAMFSVSKLKLLKKPLRKLKYAQGDLARKVSDSRHELERVQAMIVTPRL
ncbi:gamma interferon inducible lysosomal thiol reductase [Tanacetum coccineum]